MKQDRRRHCLIYFRNGTLPNMLSSCVSLLQPVTPAIKRVPAYFRQKCLKKSDQLSLQASYNETNYSKCFQALMGPSKGPNIKLFQRFWEY